MDSRNEPAHPVTYNNKEDKNIYYFVMKKGIGLLWMKKVWERRSGSSNTNFIAETLTSEYFDIKRTYRQFLHRDCNGTFCVKVFTFCFCDSSFIIPTEIIHFFAAQFLYLHLRKV